MNAWDEICRCDVICECGGDDWGQEYYDAEYDGCISCGAEIDHYLGCPDDPNPDYEAEQEYLAGLL